MGQEHLRTWENATACNKDLLWQEEGVTRTWAAWEPFLEKQVPLPFKNWEEWIWSLSWSEQHFSNQRRRELDGGENTENTAQVLDQAYNFTERNYGSRRCAVSKQLVVLGAKLFLEHSMIIYKNKILEHSTSVSPWNILRYSFFKINRMFGFFSFENEFSIIQICHLINGFLDNFCIITFIKNWQF